MIYDEIPKNNIEKTSSFKENQVLFEKLKNGDKRARETLIYNNLGIITSIINHKFVLSFDNNLLSYEDIFMIGIEGLIKAIDNFDISKNYKFSTFAYKCIKNEILQYIKKCRNTLEYSLDEMIEKQKEKNFIFSSKYDMASQIEFEETKNELRKIFKNLTPYEKKLLSLYMGIRTKKLSGKEIGKIFGCSQSYCNRIKKQTLQKMYKQLQKNNS